MEGSDEYLLQLMPACGAGTVFKDVIVNGRSVKFSELSSSQTVQPHVTIPIAGETEKVTILFKPTVELIPPFFQSKIGDSNRGLKIISITRDEHSIILQCEGIHGATYQLGLTCPDKIRSTEGAVLSGEQLSITFPNGPHNTFIRHQVIIHLN